MDSGIEALGLIFICYLVYRLALAIGHLMSLGCW